MSAVVGSKRFWRGQAILNNGTAVVLRTAKSATTSTIFVTKITLSITTHANTKTVSVQDTAGSPLVIAVHNDLTAAAGVPSELSWEFGDRIYGGVQLTTGANLTAVSQASGVAGIVYAEGYEVVPT